MGTAPDELGKAVGASADEQQQLFDAAFGGAEVTASNPDPAAPPADAQAPATASSAPKGKKLRTP